MGPILNLLAVLVGAVVFGLGFAVWIGNASLVIGGPLMLAGGVVFLVGLVRNHGDHVRR